MNDKKAEEFIVALSGSVTEPIEFLLTRSGATTRLREHAIVFRYALEADNAMNDFLASRHTRYRGEVVPK